MNSSSSAVNPNQYATNDAGEKFENELSTFYNELYVFSPPHNRWTRYTSPSAPLPRSGHQMAVHPLTGQMYLFGGIIPRRTIIDMTGEFSSPKGNTFYHYSDLHQLNPQTRQFTKIQTSGPSPSARSGHRMIFWRHLLLLFGGFHDTSSITKYHNDLWVFDSVEEKWTEIKSPTGRCPEPRSGFTFLPSMDGGVVIGGYAKVKGNAGKLRGVIYNGSSA
jgi:N-acetylneuraminic acid mutarotase